MFFSLAFFFNFIIDCFCLFVWWVFRFLLFYKYLLRACYKASCFYHKRKRSKNFWQKLL
ncbi:hypothetical protein HPOKI828_04980 [Helicobacter pylori oki828]|nr:hypothetical protein HPOKI828_04980 [Helicobacter pylori oki828]